MRKGSKHTVESLARMKGVNKGNTNRRGVKLSLATRRKLSLSHMGHKLSKKAKSILLYWSIGDKNSKWKGDKVGYRALHSWIRRKLGDPKECVYCGKQQPFDVRKIICWANISHRYLRDLNDWIALCMSCNFQYDLGKINIDHIISSSIAHERH